MALHNRFIPRLPSETAPCTDLTEMKEVRDRVLKDTDISDHLPDLFAAALAARPKLIVELGVRGGESAFVFERISKLYGSHWVSVDIEDCSRISSYPNWYFVQSDDIQFSKQFPGFCRESGFEPSIDLLFIDTSHLYEHTVLEISHWFPFLAPECHVLFHDTNQALIVQKKDGKLVYGADNRGVIAPIEEYFGCKFDERSDFTTVRQGWIITHRAMSHGFTALHRLPELLTREE